LFRGHKKKSFRIFPKQNYAIFELEKEKLKEYFYLAQILTFNQQLWQAPQKPATPKM
jgi:hypothetical protein